MASIRCLEREKGLGLEGDPNRSKNCVSHQCQIQPFKKISQIFTFWQVHMFLNLMHCSKLNECPATSVQFQWNLQRFKILILKYSIFMTLFSYFAFHIKIFQKTTAEDISKKWSK